MLDAMNLKVIFRDGKRKIISKTENDQYDVFSAYCTSCVKCFKEVLNSF